MYKLDELNIFKSEWLNTIKSILNNSGFSGIWLSQAIPYSIDNFRNLIKLRLRDQFIQKWHDGISQGGKCTNYRMFKLTFRLERYLIELPDQLCKSLTRFRCRNHRLPIESGCRENIQSNMRTCQYCLKDIGDEFHYLLSCSHFNNTRKQYIHPKFWNNPSTFQMERLMNIVSDDELKKLSLFIKYILAQF